MGLIDNMLKFSGLKKDSSIDSPLNLNPAQKSTLEYFKTRMDDFANYQTSQGTAKDKKMWSFNIGYILDQFQLDMIYQNSDIASSIVDIPAFECMRQGFQIKIEGAQDQSQLESLDLEMKSFGINHKITYAEVFSRLYGGAALLILVNDGLNPWDPLDYSKIQSIENIVTVDRYELVNSGIVDMNVKSEDFAQPQYYTLASIDPKMSGLKIHNSRVIRFDGVQLSRRRMANFQYWGQSVINRVYNVIRDYESTNSAIASLIQDFNIMVFKIAELAAVISGSKEGQRLLQSRLDMAAQMGSLLNALIIRPEEEIEFKARNISGVDGIVDRITDRLIVAARIPRLLLLGQGKGGLGTNNDNEVRMFYDQIKSYQNNVLESKIRKVVNVFMASKTGPFAGNIKKFEICFNPLWQMTEKEQSEVYANMANADNGYIMNGVLSPDEVANSRFGSGTYSMNTILDKSLRSQVNQANGENANLEDPNQPKDRPFPDNGTNAFTQISSASGAYPQGKF